MPARISWLGYGEGARFGLAINDLVKQGRIKAPMVIARDDLDCASSASPFGETEGYERRQRCHRRLAAAECPAQHRFRRDGVSIQNGGGTGDRILQHAGQVMVADGTEEMARRIERVLTNDAGLGIVRQVDAGNDEAREFARHSGIKVPIDKYVMASRMTSFSVVVVFVRA